ncbi:hypothetical protein HOLleu_36315 [Holothuria leucospilota]|uniref:Netrin receptor UNC5 n=1 Tax=Holothuria leucospilota TaxID=206669 RepID=A0A9Q1BGI1_HOLLE|nr:hypothetical protein HOLleu_36315 [Holothuria leucospilota]
MSEVGRRIILIVQHERFTTKQHGYQLEYLTLDLSGNIAVSGYHSSRRTYIDLYSGNNSDSRDKLKLFYSKEFEKYSYYWYRYVSFLDKNVSSKLVTCIGDKIEIIDTKDESKVLPSCRVNGRTTCLAVREGEIFIGLRVSQTVLVFNNDLKETKYIRIKGIEDGDWPRDLQVITDAVFVCTQYGRVLSLSVYDGSIVSEYTDTTAMYAGAWSIAVSEEMNLVAVLWGRRRIIVYSLNKNKSFLVFDVDNDVTRIRISDRDRMIIIGNKKTGEIQMYSLKQLFSFEAMKWTLAYIVSPDECEELQKFFGVTEEEIQRRLEAGDEDNKLSYKQKTVRKMGCLLTVIEEKGHLNPYNVDILTDAVSTLGDKNHNPDLKGPMEGYSLYGNEPSPLGLLSHGVVEAAEARRTEELESGRRMEGYHSKRKGWRLTLHETTVQGEPLSLSSYTSRKTIITKVGGTLEISNTGILLVIPPNALPSDKDEHEIHMRYIPRRAVKDQVKCFSSNSTAVVEIFPNLSLQHSVRLSLPHCLVLQQNLERKAKIFASHHEKGTHLFWEEQKDVSYHIEDTTCIMLLNSFSWYKYCIDDEIVIAKKIVVYTAAQEPKPHDDVVRIEVGCYPDLPGQEEDIPGGQNLVVAHKKILYFLKSEKQHPLQISLNDIFPSGWQCRRTSNFTDTLSKKIPYSKISREFGDSCVYILEKSSHAAGMPLCVFTASQDKDVEMDNIAVQLAVNLQVIEKVPPNIGVTGNQCESSLLKAETNITKSGVKLEIPGTGVELKIPPNALEGNGEDHLIGMRIIPCRIIEDQVTSLSSNACTAVEVYPHTISLRQPAKLKLPHCLAFYEDSYLRARIFTNYQIGGAQPSGRKIQN